MSNAGNLNVVKNVQIHNRAHVSPRLLSAGRRWRFVYLDAVAGFTEGAFTGGTTRSEALLLKQVRNMKLVTGRCFYGDMLGSFCFKYFMKHVSG